MFFPSSGPMYWPWKLPSTSQSSSINGSRKIIAKLCKTAHAPEIYLTLSCVSKIKLLYDRARIQFVSVKTTSPSLPMIVHTLSGCIRISEWRTWNRLFHHPKVLSMVTLVLECAVLNLSSAGVEGLRYGVIRYFIHAYPLSPRRMPSPTERKLRSKSPLIPLMRKIWLSWQLPGQRATIFVNLPV